MVLKVFCLDGGWNTVSPIVVTIGTSSMPVSKLLPNGSKIWCACGNSIKVFNKTTITIEHTFTVNNDINKPITNMVISGNGVWISLQNSAIVKCFHASSYEFV